MTNTDFFLIVALILAVIIWYFLHKNFKMIRTNSLALISGGIKTGKSSLSTYLALKEYKRQHRKWVIKSKIFKFLNKGELEEPLLYSNISLSVPFVPVTTDLLERKNRFNYGSVILLSEVSLVADSQLVKDNVLNDELLMFCKLIAHELGGHKPYIDESTGECVPGSIGGGKMIIDTQCISDCHYAFKRCLSEYFYIHHTVKLPFFMLMYVREERYSEDGNVINSYNEDVEETLKKILVPKSVWKKFDCYTYSVLTDDKNTESELTYTDNLKTNKIVSFKKRFMK